MLHQDVTTVFMHKIPSNQRVIRFIGALREWYNEERRPFPWRDTSAGLYERIVVEVLLQRTRVETVAVFLPGFLAHFPSWKAIAETNEVTLGAMLKPLGLWRRRASALLALSRYLVSLGEEWPTTREQLEKIPAVGQYVANAVLLFAHGKAEPLMDSSMARLLRRYFGLAETKVDIRYDERLHSVAYAVLHRGNPIELNWAMLDLAAKICRPATPVCNSCPLKRPCRFRLDHRDKKAGQST